MKKIIFIISILLFTLTAYAAGGSQGGIPVGFIKLQLINFVVFIVLIGLIVKFKVNPALELQRKAYLDQADEAAKKLEESQNERDSLKRKLSDMQLNFEKNISEAEENAEKKYKAQLDAAKESSQRISKDLEHQVKTMKHIYWSRLKENLFESSVAELKKEVEDNIDPVAIEQLQKSFVERMDVRI